MLAGPQLLTWPATVTALGVRNDWATAALIMRKDT
jgi:hypothetical protein